MIVLYRYCKTVYALLVNSKAKGDTLLIKQVSEGRFAVGGVDTRKVAMQIIKPGNPPLYRLTSLPTDKKKRLNMKIVAYTRAQLQVVKKKAQDATPGQEIFNVERLVGYDKRKRMYLVKWVGFPSAENSYVKAGALIGISNADKKAARDAAK